MTIDSTAFAWLEVPSSATSSSFSSGFTLSFAPGACSDADNVTPPHPHNQAGTQQKGVSICTLGGTWQVQSDHNISWLVAAGPYSEMNGTWPTPSDQSAWTGDSDVIVLYIKYKP
jgi:hypothetical protein